ncbi:hypothetical protein HN51_020797 [Arachis hypogaea]|uniref:NAC domain-containing protein n=1 Tax=Arachis hypogaea TaxID=3818 RepID=A0A445C2C6_ARAHY|nr:NAC domain-containing protein 100 [Arachis hypogaea]QHO32831.1 NAC domain-containing protein [Arachis hypogaea]RYR45059.1 hypothetical protein Ahy_A08g041304 [Arachis hypogaea]
MENICSEVEMDLPPGFRFHPTDEELISHYLYNKVIDTNFSARAIAEVDLNRSEPWDLPWKAKMGEKEWYFFCVRDRKYPTGLRTNRATEAGYWKATGKDKEIYRGKSLVGMKKTLVFYKGRAPKGEKSDWVMHEFRLHGKFNPHNLPKSAKNEWVICRVFQKSSAAKKIHLTGIMRLDSSVFLPPLADSSSSPSNTATTAPYVPCFSNPIIHNQVGIFDPFSNTPFVADSFYSSQGMPMQHAQPPSSTYSASGYTTHDHSILRALLQNNSSNLRNGFKPGEREMAHHQTSLVDANNNNNNGITSVVAPQDLSSLWNYQVQIK